jgi:hypothetical protein
MRASRAADISTCVMAGLGPAIHDLASAPQVVDARAKPGHDN